MYTALCFCIRDTLYAVHTRLIFQCTISVLRQYIKYNFFIPPCSAFGIVNQFGFPTAFFTVAYIHTVKVACKKCCFVASSTTAYLHYSMLGILWFFRDQHQTYFLFLLVLLYQ